MKIRLALVLLFVSLLLCPCIAEGIDYPSEDSLLADMSAVGEISERLEAAIAKAAPYLRGARLDHVTVNPNYGTAQSGDFIGLVYVVLDGTGNDDEIGSNAVTASHTIASMANRECPELCELCVFWDFAAYGLDGKLAYTLDADGYHYTDGMMPRQFMGLFQ